MMSSPNLPLRHNSPDGGDQPRRSKQRVMSKAAVGLTALNLLLVICAVFLVVTTWDGLSQPQAVLMGGLSALTGAGIAFYGSHRTRISSEQTAAAALKQAKDQLDEQQRSAGAALKQAKDQLDEQQRTTQLTHDRETVKELRARYTISAEQLANSSAAIRLAGVYALAALSDDWGERGNIDEQQVSIDLLRAYLRTPSQFNSEDQDQVYGRATEKPKPDRGELEVRKTIVLTIHKRSRQLETGDPKSWRARDCSMRGAELSTIALSGADLGGADLTGADLTGADLTYANLTYGVLTNANLTDARLSGANLTKATIHSANLTDANLTDGVLTNANLTDANLTRAIPAFAQLSGANLTRANLTDANLTKTNLYSANLTNADLTDAVLTNANLTGADLTSANLTGADVTGADLSDVNLTDANLTDADLTDAKIYRTNLTNANLTDADLTSANITGADLTAAAIPVPVPPRSHTD